MTQVNSQHTETGPPPSATSDTAEPGELFGLLAEFEHVDQVKHAAVALKRAGYRYFDVHSPFPIHGIEDALNVKPTILPWLVLAGGLTGMIGGLTLAVHTMGYGIIPQEWLPVNFEGYGYLISGKPMNSLPAWIPVVFECTILFAALTAVFGMLLMNRLPMLYHPLLNSERFKRATNDRFFVSVLSRDRQFDRTRTAAFLQDQGADAVEEIEQ